MKDNRYPVWTSSHSKTAMFYTLILCGVTLAYFNISAIQPIWFLITLSVVVWYFATLSIYSDRWKNLSSGKFKKRIFWHSLFYRVLTSIVLITVAYVEWGKPDYLGAVDALDFHEQAIIIAEHYRNFDFSGAFTKARSFYVGIDNIGPSLFIGFIFALSGDSYFVATVFLAVLGSISVVLLYLTGKLIWGEQIGRTAGIMFMHFPLSLFFSVVIMKEGVVLFLLMFIIYILTRAVNGDKLKLVHIILLIISLYSLFFFRTVVGIILIILVTGTLLLNKYKGSRFKSWSIGTIIILIFAYLMYALGEYQFFMDRISETDRIRSTRETNVGLDRISVQNIILVPFLFIFSLITPVPGFVETPLRFNVSHDHNYYFIPGLIIWNILVYYSIIGLFFSIKEKFLNSMPLWGFSVMYSLAMIATFLFSRVRFSYLGMAILILLAAVGLTYERKKIYWKIYFILLVFISVAWNILRLSVRGAP